MVAVSRDCGPLSHPPQYGPYYWGCTTVVEKASCGETVVKNTKVDSTIFSTTSNWGRKNPINRKHINILLTALVGQSSQGRTATRPTDKRDKMAILLWNSTAGLSQGRVPVCPRKGSPLSQERFLFVPDTLPPKMFMFIGFFLARAKVFRRLRANLDTRPTDKRDKMAILLCNSTEKGRFVPGKGPGLPQERVPFVPGTVPVCPRHRPTQNVYVYWFFSCPILGF